MEVGEGYNGELKNSGATAHDATYSSAAFLGVKVTYTSSRADDYYFDFKIDPPSVIIDPFFVETLTVFSETELDLTFNRAVDFGGVATNDFWLNGSLNPQNVTNLGATAMRLTFGDEFAGGANELAISGIEPSTNNTVLADTTLTFFVFEEYVSGDVLINEFLKDPPTGSGLPEYVEIVNTSGKVLNLKNWQIGDNSSLTSISDTNFVLLPDTFFVLTSNPEDLVSVFGEVYAQDVSLPALNNTTDQIRLFIADGSLADSLEYSPGWGGVDVALERRTPDVSATVQANWGDSPNALFGTPGRRNEIEPDTTPPDIDSWTMVNDSLVLVIFTEEVKSAPALELSNYVLIIQLDNNLPAPQIEAVDFRAPDTVHVSFDRPFKGDANGENYALDIQNQVDVFGNVNPSLLVSLGTFFEFGEADSGDVAINEFMYDPGDEYSEFVELVNRSGTNFNLQDWTFNDNSGSQKTITNDPFILGPGRFVTLVPDSTIPENFGVQNFLRVTGFPALNYSTDQLVLKNADGLTIDSLQYFSSWGGEEVSLERRRTDITPNHPANWGDSPAANYATPGRANEVEQDEQGPQMLQAIPVSINRLLVLFDEEPFFNGENFSEPFSLNPPLGVQDFEHRGDSLFLNLQPGESFEDGQEYILTAYFLMDIFGNTVDEQSVNFSYVEVGEAEATQVVINEILYRRADELSPEFIELFNRSTLNFDLSGWSFNDAGNSTTHLPEGTILSAGEYLVLTDREAFAESIPGAIYLSDFPTLNDSGDGVILKNSEGLTIDSLFYRSDWGGDSPGTSIERKDPGGPSADPANWATSTASGGNSAGLVSSVFEEDVSPPEIIFVSMRQENMLVVFNEFVRLDDETVFLVQEYSVENISQFNSNPAQVVLNISRAEVEAADDGSAFEVTVMNVTDFRGNKADEKVAPIAVPLTGSEVVINEIMYNPLANSEDNLPDQTEYIELFNPGDRAVSLEGMYLHDAPDELNEVRAIAPVSTSFSWISPGGFALVYAEDEASEFGDSRLARYFSMEEEDDRFALRVDRSSLSLGSTSDAIFLADSSGTTVDSVFFDEGWQNPNVFDTRGIALERIDPLGLSNNPGNWSSSTYVSGGTPLAENSIFQQAGSVPEGVGISFNPNPFSPDEDGFEDNLFINYSLDAPDYLLRVRIFDRYGREVRELVEGHQAGFEGSVIWDGLTDDGNRNRVGIYIVLFEAYNSTTGKNHTFKKTVVLARMF
jgi:hypothetical protein